MFGSRHRVWSPGGLRACLRPWDRARPAGSRTPNVGDPRAKARSSEERRKRPWDAGWQVWAILSAVFAALTAIFAKIGVENVEPDFATLVRTIVILGVVAILLSATGHWQAPSTVSARTWLFLVLSGAATGLSWLCYFRALRIGEAAKVAPVDKLSVVLVAIFAALVLGERMSLAGWLGVALIAAGSVLVALAA